MQSMFTMLMENCRSDLQAQTTTDVIVVDAHRTVVYHGAIDDQYGFGYARAEPKQHFLTRCY